MGSFESRVAIDNWSWSRRCWVFQVGTRGLIDLASSSIWILDSNSALVRSSCGVGLSAPRTVFLIVFLMSI